MLLHRPEVEQATPSQENVLPGEAATQEAAAPGKARRPHLVFRLGYPRKGPEQGLEDQQWPLHQYVQPHVECWPEQMQGANTLEIAMAHVTEWNTFLDSDLIQNMRVYASCIPEHKLTTKQQVSKTRNWLKTREYTSTFGKARITEKGYPSSRAAVLWTQGLHRKDAWPQGQTEP